MPDGQHWSEKRGQLGGDFSTCALPRLGDRIGAVAGNNQFLFFAEMHDDISTLNVLSDADTLRGLAQGGHKAIATEMFDISYNKFFDGYYNGEFSNDAMKFALENMPNNLEADMGIENGQDYLKRYSDMAITARENGIRMYGVGGSEGFYDRSQLPQMESFYDSMGSAFYDAMKTADSTEGFYTMPREQQSAILGQTLSDANYPVFINDSVIGALGLGESGSDSVALISDKDADEMMSTMIERLDQDDIVAGRIADISAELGGGVTAIYGGLHLWRGGTSEGDYGAMGRDIDGVLGDHRSAVISVFGDSREFWQSTHPEMRAAREALGIRFENAGDYQIDMKNGKWYDGRTDSDCKVELPDSLKPGGQASPPPAPEIAPARNVFEGVKW